MDILQQLSLIGIVPVIAIDDAADAVPLCRALADGGLPCAEITFRTAAAEEAIRNVSGALPDVLVGAGTVLTVEQVDRAVAAGAKFIVSPGLNPEVVRHCLDLGVPVTPGTSNPSDIEAALALGLKTVKFFPAEAAGGIKYIKAIAAPYVDVTFMPTGGIGEKNLLEYLSFGRIKCCGGSWMAPKNLIAARDWAKIRELTASAVRLMLGFELAHVGVNCGTGEEAVRTAEALCSLFGWPVLDNDRSTFAGTAVEVMKGCGRGRNGHIAVATNFLPRARAYLERKGFAFDERTLVVKDGKPALIYLRDEIAGFAVHLVQK